MKLDTKQKKYLLIGLGVVAIAYFFWKKSQSKTTRPCKKWIQPKCITTPCPPSCAEY